ncbi:MAG: TAXI family TRAP transporter solute-binding subunit [Pseudomonadota bacterium]
MRLYILLALVTIASLVAAAYAMGLAPPKSLSIAAGSATGGYYRIAQRYQAVLAEDGITLDILETAGSVENAALIAAGRADIALIQGGVEVAHDDGQAEALGAIFYEPVFIFHRRDATVSPYLSDWTGLTIAGGAPGSGTRAAVQALFAGAGVAEEANRLLPLSGRTAADALAGGEVEAAVFVAPLSAPYLAPLLAGPDIALLEIAQLPALSSLLGSSSVVTMPAGGISYSERRPERETALLLMVARLVARADLHPSLVNRLVRALRIVHGGRDALTGDQQFPSLDAVAMPVDLYAQTLIREGPSPLEQLLPYWVAAQISRFAILLLPILFLLLPLFQALPGVYAWRMRAKLYRHYNELLEIDEKSLGEGDADRLRAHVARLEELDRDLVGIRLPVPYRNLAYSTRLHLDLVRKRLREKLAEINTAFSG